MRSDHHAYQRATGVAAAGLFAQLAIALALLIFGKSTEDTTSVIASAWAFSGLVVWLGLILIFHQHRLERLESLEMEGGARLDDGGRLFAADDARVARKRLGQMHSYMMPALSLLYALLYGLLSAEDYALLMGSLLVFALLAGVMLLTRKLDWYALGKSPA